MTNEESSGKVFREIYASVVFIWKLLRVTAAIEKKLQSSGEFSNISALSPSARQRSCGAQGAQGSLSWLEMQGWLLVLHCLNDIDIC